MALADVHLEGPEQPEPTPRARSEAPGFLEWDGTKGALNTPVLEGRPTTWDAYLIESGLDPADVEVEEPVSVRGWQVQRKTEAGTEMVWAHYFRLMLRTRRAGPSIADLLGHVRKAKARTVKLAVAPTFIVALGDLQLGKVDGDGVAGTVDRTVAGITEAAERYKVLRKRGQAGPVHLAWLGDGCEGFVSQGGDSAWRTCLTMTEQVRLLRRIMLHTTDTFAALSDTVTQVCVPGNHDQAVRFGKGGITRYDDSHDVEAMVAVSDAIALNPGAYGHVRTFTPANDELTVTMAVGDTTVTHAHGHMWRQGKHFDWWSGQAFGDHPSGTADILLSAHGHHLVIEQRAHRTFVMVPAMESESTWWRHKTGQSGAPGVFTATASGGRLGNIHIT